MQEHPFVSIIVLNYNGLQYLNKCLNSLQKISYPKKRYKIIVVDNGSIDDSVAFIRKEFPNVIIIQHPKNLGVCIANNHAIQQCDSPYVLLLNNDLHVHKNFLSELVSVMKNDKEIGCCGGDEYYYTDNISTPTGKVRETSWMGGGATIYRKQALEEAGFFDENFFFYCEDIDLSWRLKLKGWKIFQNERAIFYHAGKNRPVKITDKSFFYAWRNRIFLLIKYASIPQTAKSLRLYTSLFIRRKPESTSKEKDDRIIPIENRQQIHENNRQQTYTERIKKYALKFFFLAKLSIIIVIYAPLMFYKRCLLRKWITNQKEVDSWFDYIDKQLFHEQHE